jgi:ActR/RegA family two-component response regulator
LRTGSAGPSRRIASRVFIRVGRGTAAAQGARVRHRLLVVEDHAATPSGIAARAADAISLLSSRRYAAVIADLQLAREQEAEGLAIVVEARHRCPATRIVVLTGAGCWTVEEAARLLGAHLFLQKDTGPQDVERAVRTLMEAAP